MYYAPHILEKKNTLEYTKDSYGRKVPISVTETWTKVCDCRCDKSTDREITNDNGEVVRPSFHVVCDKKSVCNVGDTIRCKLGTTTICEGKVTQVKNTNYFDYSEVWL